MNLFDRVIRQGQLLFGVAITAFGAEHLVCARFGQSVVPVIPWVPGNHPWYAYLVGIGLLVAGFNIETKIRSHIASAAIAVFLFGCFLVLWIPQLIAAPLDLGIRTRAFETLTLCAAASMLAGTHAGHSTGLWRNSASLLVSIGRYFFAISAVIFGVDHFFILGFIASLIPNWIPFHMFWAWFTGAAFVAAGLSIATGWKARWGATWLGIMFFLWFVLLHAPRVLSAPRSHDPNEWSSAFIALGICGGSWICASAMSRRRELRVLAAKAA